MLHPYAGGDTWVLVASPDLRKRLLWTVWCDGGNGDVRGLAAGSGTAAAAARAGKAPFYPTDAVQATAPAGGAGCLAVWPTGH